MMNCDERGIPKIGSPWIHKKNETEYTVYDITNDEADVGRNAEYPITVSYIGSNGKKWSKPLDNFLDRMRPSDGEWGKVPVLQVPSQLAADAWRRAVAMGDYAGNMYDRVARNIVQHENFRALLFTHTHSSAVLCCIPTARDLELLNSGEYTPEELWGGPRPTCPACINNGKPAKTKTPWLPYLIDRADGVAGHYAIGRWNPAGYQEVWSLWRHCWGSASEDVLTHDEALALLKSVTLQGHATKQKPSTPVFVEQECAANTPKFPPLKINVTTDASSKQDEGLWYYVNANDVFVDQTAEAIRSVLVEVGGALAGAKTDAALSRAKLDWKRPQPVAMRDQIADNGMNYVGPVSIHGPVIWGNRTARGGVLPDLVVVAAVLHEVSKYARNHSDKRSSFDLSFWFALQQRAADVARYFAETHMLSPAGVSFFWAESRNCVLHLTFPMSAISGSQDQSFEVEVLMDKGEFRINMDETIAGRIDEVVSLDWILMG